LALTIALAAATNKFINTNNMSRPVVNPYLQRLPFAAANKTINVVKMGRQSQVRVSNTKQKHQLASTNNSYKKKTGLPKAGDQLTLFGERALDSIIDCVVCSVHKKKKTRHKVTIPHCPHHVLCVKNKVSGGKGLILKQQVS